jgi:hypothetical protein
VSITLCHADAAVSEQHADLLKRAPARHHHGGEGVAQIVMRSSSASPPCLDATQPYERSRCACRLLPGNTHGLPATRGNGSGSASPRPTARCADAARSLTAAPSRCDVPVDVLPLGGQRLATPCPGCRQQGDDARCHPVRFHVQDAKSALSWLRSVRLPRLLAPHLCVLGRVLARSTCQRIATLSTRRTKACSD